MKEEKLIQSNFIRTNLTYDLFKQSMVMINVYYDDLHYTIISETPTYQIIDLIGLIGLNLNFNYIEKFLDSSLDFK
jgi:hypothetical protein